MKMFKAAVVAASATTAMAVCVDMAGFMDELGQDCSFWAGLDDCRDAINTTAITDAGLQDVLANCQLACDSCVKATDFCEIGLGGDTFKLDPPTTDDFDFMDQEFLSELCRWNDKEEGLHMNSNAWGNQPGRNFVFGCMALIKDVEYTDFIIQVDAYHDDNDAFGWILGYQDNSTYIQAWQQNDYWWPPNPADGIPGPVLKFSNRAGTECFPEMNETNLCFDTFAYNANFDTRHESASMARYPNGRNSSVPYYPDPYWPGYQFFHHNDVQDYVVRHTLVVYKGEMRAYYWSDEQNLVGVWSDVPDNYVGGRIGLFVSAHQPTITNISVLDLSDSATPLTTMCEQAGATCDTTLGVCLGGPTFNPTVSPTPQPTLSPTMPVPTDAFPTMVPTILLYPSSCVDDPAFTSEEGLACADYAVYSDCRDIPNMTVSDAGLVDLMENCQLTCDSCVKASQFCEIGEGGDRFELLPPWVEHFTFVDQELLSDECVWVDKPEQGLHMSSNAWGNQPGRNFVMGCMALVNDVEYTDFILEIEAYHDDNDAFGHIFGYQDEKTYYQAWGQNDYWWPPFPGDGVPGPVLKVSARRGKDCYGSMFNKSSLCYDTIAYNANFDERHESSTIEGYPNGRTSSVPYYPAPYADGYRTYHHNDVEDHVVRHVLIVYKGEFRSYHYSDSQEACGVWGSLPADYAGGKVGIFVSAHQPTISRLAIVDLSDGAAPMTTECINAGDSCDKTTGLCPYVPTLAPTMAPTMSKNPTMAPTLGAINKVAASGFCQGPISDTAKTVVDTTVADNFLFVEQEPITAGCQWITNATGLSQVSNAWGNAPGDNTVMGCVALYPTAYTDFIFEIDVTHQDNDGWGVIFGFDNSTGDHYMGAAMNQNWPVVAADGIRGPFLKLKKTNGKPCTGQMDNTTVCYDTLAHIDIMGYNREAMGVADGTILAREYESTYPYADTELFEQATKMVLIVSGQEARVYFPSPGKVLETNVSNYRQGVKSTATWTFDLQGYAGGFVGVFTYAHEATFSNWRITDITDPSAITAYCDGLGGTYCDNERGDSSTGLCVAVPVSDVCEDPVGATVFDTSTFSTFDLFDDPGVEGCTWSISGGSKIYQQSNANSGTTIILGCNAIVNDPQTYTDFIMQVDIDNNDNDAVGLQFGWRGIDDHFRMHKMNDRWPVPAADGVPGPVFKLRRKIPGVPCMAGTEYTQETSCYQIVSYIDASGPFHDGLAKGAVTPFEYANTYIPFSQSADARRMVLIVRGGLLRAYYEDADLTKAVGVFAYDLKKYDYVGGQVGLFIAGHQAGFSNFKIASLSGPNATTEFCEGRNFGCNARHGLCAP